MMRTGHQQEFLKATHNQSDTHLLRAYVARLIESNGVAELDNFVATLELGVIELFEKNPAALFLRDVQLFLSDLRLELKQQGFPEQATRVHKLKDELYGLIRMAYRNPKDQLLERSFPKQIMRLVEALGPDCTEGELIAKENIMRVHFQRMATVLVAYGYLTRHHDGENVVYNIPAHVPAPAQNPV